MTRQRMVRGYTFRHPDGKLDYRIVENVGAAQSNAAFASDRPYSHISLPSDWHRAHKQGFRIVAVAMVAGRTQHRWRQYQPEDED